MTELTEARLRILRGATYHRGIGYGRIPVVSNRFISGFEAVTEKKNLKWLEVNGYLEPSLHGDWYMTDKGVEAVVDAGCAADLERAQESPRG